MSDLSPILWWVRRDLRLTDNPALSVACASGHPVIPVFLYDEVVEGLGAAPKWRFMLGVAAFARGLEAKGARLVLRRGAALDTLRALIDETGAAAVIWARAYDPASVARDKAVKAALKEAGVEARSVPGHLLFEPWNVETGEGGYYKVYTPFWKAVCDRDVPEPRPAPGRFPAPENWPDSEDLDAWQMGAAMHRGAAVVADHVTVGEEAAHGRLGAFMANGIAEYAERRDFPAAGGTSRLSENLTYGEISPHLCWHAALRARDEGKRGAETFLKELVWREFAYHLLWHTPRLANGNWREDWDAFPWSEDDATDAVTAWRRGRTGIPFVDAAMREMYVTGTMHNRARMVVASWLTKNLMTHWKIGLDWFADHLIDWDPASNALGWQWVAGSGPDAAPYFRIFNPMTQREKFDPDRTYVETWIAEGQARPPRTALSYFEAIPQSWGLSPDDAYPVAGVDPGISRKRALEAYEARDF